MSEQSKRETAERLMAWHKETDRKRVKAGLCRHCGGKVPCWSAFGDESPGKKYSGEAFLDALKREAVGK